MAISPSEIKKQLAVLGYESLYDENEIENLALEVQNRLENEFEYPDKDFTTYKPQRAYTDLNMYEKPQQQVQQNPKQQKRFGTFDNDEDIFEQIQQINAKQESEYKQKQNQLESQIKSIPQRPQSQFEQYSQFQQQFQSKIAPLEPNLDLDSLADQILQTANIKPQKSLQPNQKLVNKIQGDDLQKRIQRQQEQVSQYEQFIQENDPQMIFDKQKALNRQKLINKKADPVERNQYYNQIWKMQGAPEDRQKRLMQIQMDKLSAEALKKRQGLAKQSQTGEVALTKYQMISKGRFARK